MRTFSQPNRDHVLILGATSNLVARALHVLTGLLATKLSFGALGAERYGILVTLTATFTMLAFADLGVGNGMVNRIVGERAAGGSKSTVKTTISSGAAVLVLVAAVVLSLAMLFESRLNWPSLMKVTDPRAALESRPAVIATFVMFAVGLPVAAVQKISFAYQLTHVANAINALGGIVVLGVTYYAALANSGIATFAIIGASLPVFTGAITWIAISRLRGSEVIPSLRSIDRSLCRRLLVEGLSFLSLQVLAAGLLQAPMVIIAAVNGADQVSKYAITFRLASYGPMIVAMLVTPLWPAFADAVNSNDQVWIKRRSSSALAGSAVLGVVFAAVFVAGVPSAVKILTNDALLPSKGLVLALAAFSVFHSIRWAVSMILCGLNVVTQQIIPHLIGSAIVLCPHKMFSSSATIETMAMTLAFAECLLTLLLMLLLRRSSDCIHIRKQS